MAKVKAIAAVMVVLSLGACGLKSVDTLKEEKLNACKQIHDEPLRVQCITAVR